jgi:hypothetical protein
MRRQAGGSRIIRDGEDAAVCSGGAVSSCAVQKGAVRRETDVVFVGSQPPSLLVRSLETRALDYVRIMVVLECMYE